MRKNIPVILAALFILCGVSLNFIRAAEGKISKKAEVRTFTGIVDSVSLADPEKGVKSELSAIDTNNKKTVFLVTATTTMYNAKSAPINLDKIKKGEKVKVKFITTKEGVNEAISVRIAP
ncbi:MAG: hypothetical protein HZA14_08530 [Nitrospirae bacterium]|nr:hypothetical protein [Nitrospirota bacterium]